MVSMGNHEQDLLFGVELTHKVIRSDTVLDVLVRRNLREYSETRGAVVGLVVVTAYNNRSYLIHDVDLSKSPSSIFTVSNGRSMTFAEYYFEVS